ncbi:RNA polymerase sigma factor WhiG [Clostridia bacterium]|nr:RNA polymerase sigma factor WhiG [Clostridia bacterium]
MKTADREQLWTNYKKNKSAQIREQIILEYASLVKVVAGRLSLYLGKNVEYEEMVSCGVFGLIDAVDKFDSAKEVKFETYASLRIRGAILDQIRKMDWIPRTVRQRQRMMDEAIKDYEARNGKSPTDEQLAESLQMPAEELIAWQAQVSGANLISLNEYMEAGTGAEPVMDASANRHFARPEQVVEEEELKQVLGKSLGVLTEKERQVIELYYYEDMTLKEISNILAVTESRISQLHTKAIMKLKKTMGPYMNIMAS